MGILRNILVFGSALLAALPAIGVSAVAADGKAAPSWLLGARRALPMQLAACQKLVGAELVALAMQSADELRSKSEQDQRRERYARQSFDRQASAICLRRVYLYLNAYKLQPSDLSRTALNELGALLSVPSAQFYTPVRLKTLVGDGGLPRETGNFKAEFLDLVDRPVTACDPVGADLRGIAAILHPESSPDESCNAPSLTKADVSQRDSVQPAPAESTPKVVSTLSPQSVPSPKFPVVKLPPAPNLAGLSPPRLLAGEGKKLSYPWGNHLTEARVTLRINVARDGTPTDPEIVGGFFEPRFAELALRDVRKLRFSPASRAGVPEQSWSHEFTMNFVRPGATGYATGVTKPFRNELQEAVNLLNSERKQEALSRLENVLPSKATLLYENAVNQYFLARAYLAVGRPADSLRSAILATAKRNAGRRYFFRIGSAPPKGDPKQYVLSEPSFLENALRARFGAATSLGNVAEALQAHWELAGIVELKADDPIRLAVPKLEELFRGRAALASSGRLDGSGKWTHLLTRRFFSVSTSDAAASEVFGATISCADYTQKVNLRQGQVVELPTGAQACVLDLLGNKDTYFSVAEYSIQP